MEAQKQGYVWDGALATPYLCMQSIDIVCDYSYQILGNVYFDDIFLIYTVAQRL